MTPPLATSPLIAKKVRLSAGGSVHGYSVTHGNVVGGAVMVELVGAASGVSATQIQRRIRALIEAHLDEIVSVEEEASAAT